MDAALPSIERYLKNPAAFQDPLGQVQTGGQPQRRGQPLQPK
jgi:hypothetical protein